MISEAAIQFGMQEALQQLGIKEINEGTSTGTKWFSNGKIIESYSPATGDLIGKVKSSTKEDYETAMSAAEEAFQNMAFGSSSKKRGNRSSNGRRIA
jgi:aldehyde dehydrogenase (NAD+)